MSSQFKTWNMTEPPQVLPPSLLKATPKKTSKDIYSKNSDSESKVDRLFFIRNNKINYQDNTQYSGDRYNNFQTALLQAIKEDPSVERWSGFLTKTAKMESSFNPKAKNNIGAMGYFQFIPSTLKHLSDVSEQDFLNDPVLQIKLGAKLADSFLSQITNSDRAKAQEKGLTDIQLVAGCWLSGHGGVSAYLYKGENRSDGHQTVKQRMDSFK